MLPGSPTFVVSSTEIPDPAAFADYVEATRGTVERYGGRVRSAGPVTPLEGNAPTMVMIIEFAHVVAAASWYDSIEHQAIRSRGPWAGDGQVWLIEPAEAQAGDTTRPSSEADASDEVTSTKG